MKKKHLDGLNNPYSPNRYLSRNTHWSPNRNKTKKTISTTPKLEEFEFEIDLTMPAIILLAIFAFFFTQIMKKLKFKEPYNHHFEYQSDIDRIVKIFADRGYEISHTDAVKSWENYSEEYWFAGWLTLHETNEEIFNNLFKYFEE